MATVSAASRTNEKLYQAGQLLQLLASQQSATRSLQKGVLNAAIFSLHSAYLAFLLEVALAHHLKLVFVESLNELVPLLDKKGISDLAVRELQYLSSNDGWPAWLLGWYRTALGDDGWLPASDKPAKQHSLIGVVDVGASKMSPPTLETALDVLEKLRFFIDEQRAHLQEW